MADTKISALSDGSPLVDTDNVVIQRAAGNAKIPGSAIKTYAQSGTFIKASDDSDNITEGSTQLFVSAAELATLQTLTPAVIVDGTTKAITLGDGATTDDTAGGLDDEGQIAIGTTAAANQSGCIAIGIDTIAGGVGDSNKSEAVAIGPRAEAEGRNATSLGREATASGLNAVALGDGTNATGVKTVTIGNAGTISGDYSIGIGDVPVIQADYAIAMGQFALVKTGATNGIAIGKAAECNTGASDSIALGDTVIASVAETFLYGAKSLLLGQFTTVGLPTASTVKGAIVYDSTTDQINFSDGVSWTSLGAGSVTSVNGESGVVVLGSDDIAEGATNLYADSTNVLASLAGQALAVATINTGQGANEVYAMNQDIETTDDVVFNSVVAPVPINTQTGTTYTLVLGDASKEVTMNNAAASTLTVPPNSSVAFPTGTAISGTQLGAGQVTLTQGAGVTIRTSQTLLARAQYSSWSLLKIGTNEWLLAGDLETA